MRIQDAAEHRARRPRRRGAADGMGDEVVRRRSRCEPAGRERLDDVIRACGVIGRYVAERTALPEDLVYDAVRMRLVEIGEAVRMLPVAVTGGRTGHPVVAGLAAGGAAHPALLRHDAGDRARDRAGGRARTCAAGGRDACVVAHVPDVSRPAGTAPVRCRSCAGPAERHRRAGARPPCLPSGSVPRWRTEDRAPSAMRTGPCRVDRGSALLGELLECRRCPCRPRPRCPS